MKYCIKKILLLFTALFAILALTGCGSKMKVDLTKYVQVVSSGADGYGYANAEVDEMGLKSLLLEDDESDADSWVKLDALLKIRYELDRKDHLSNGDQITVYVTYPDSLAEALDADITPKSGESWTVEISGLGEPDRVNVFENITLEYGVGNTLRAKGQYVYLDYSLSRTQGLVNGDTVVITVSAPDGNTDLDRYCMEHYGWMPVSDVCEYTVTGIDEYPISMETIPEEMFEQLRMIAQLRIEEMGEQMSFAFGDQGYQMNHYALESVYIASPRENVESGNKNEVYLVYKINATNPDGTRDFYYSALFTNLTIKADSGACEYERVFYPDGEYNFMFYGENYFCTGTEGEGFVGFASEEDFYNWYLADWDETWLINQYSVEE